MGEISEGTDGKMELDAEVATLSIARRGPRQAVALLHPSRAVAGPHYLAGMPWTAFVCAKEKEGRKWLMDSLGRCGSGSLSARGLSGRRPLSALL